MMRRLLLCLMILAGIFRIATPPVNGPGGETVAAARVEEKSMTVTAPRPTEAPTDQHTDVVFIECVVVYAEEPKEEPEVMPVELNRYWEIAQSITEEEFNMVSALTYVEGGAEPFEGQVAIVETVFNRVLSPYFPDTIEGVIFEEYALPAFEGAALIGSVTPTETQYEAVRHVLTSTEYVTDLDVVYFSQAAYNDSVYKKIGNHVFCRIW